MKKLFSFVMIPVIILSLLPLNSCSESEISEEEELDKSEAY